MSGAGCHAAAVLLLCVAPCVVATAEAQTPAVRRFTVADGLAHNTINGLHIDSMGYLWIATAEGISRFDGESLISYGVPDGLDHAIVNGLAEDDRGRLWVAAWNGGLHEVVETSPDHPGRVRFRREPVGVSSGRVTPGRVEGATDGSLWFVTDGDVYRGVRRADGVLSFALAFDSTSTPAESRIFRDAQGVIWITVNRGVARVTGSAVADPASQTPAGVVAFSDAGPGRVIAATATAIFEYRSQPDADPTSTWRRLDPMPDLHGREIRALAYDADGAIWIGTDAGLLRWHDDRLEPYALPATERPWVEAILLDANGSLWVGTRDVGLFRVTRPAVAAWTVADGLPGLDVAKVIEGPDGVLTAATRAQGFAHLSEGKWRRAETFGTRLVPNRLARDEAGGWWVSTVDGSLYHAPPGDFDPARARRVFQEAPDGRWPSPTLNPDPRGGMWIGGSRTLYHATSTAPDRLSAIALPGEFTDPVARVIRDRSGAVWVSGYSQLARISDSGPPRFWPNIMGRALVVDSRGWVWIGTRYDGAIVVKDPAAADPVFARFTTREGLTSGAVWALTEDRRGRMYFGTGRGLNRLDVTDGRITPLAIPAGGLQVNALLTDRTGRIWISTSSGLFEFDVDREQSERAPRVYLTAIRVNGAEVPLPHRGAQTVETMTLSPGSVQMTLAFKAVALGDTPGPTFEYRLEGVDTAWSAASRIGSVTYAGVAPGRYRFVVRPAASTSERDEASFAFIVPAPVWQRTWFIALVITVAGGAGLVLQRWRLRHQRALEQLRRQVALDLHDDVGSGLAEIAILSEVARESPDRAGEIWSEVGDHARALRETMTDIVWSIDPREDRLDSLVHRMRRVASNLLASSGTRLEFISPDAALLHRLRIAPDRRRHLLLICKEGVHNITKHAGATVARVTLSLDATRLRLEMQDDGSGFDREQVTPGRGLESLERRARLIGGTLSVQSAPRRGTTIVLDAPLK